MSKLDEPTARECDGDRARVVEQAHRVLHALIEERHTLRAHAADAALEEATRIAIAYWRGVIESKLGRAA